MSQFCGSGLTQEIRARAMTVHMPNGQYEAIGLGNRSYEITQHKHVCLMRGVLPDGLTEVFYGLIESFRFLHHGHVARAFDQHELYARNFRGDLFR